MNLVGPIANSTPVKTITSMKPVSSLTNWRYKNIAMVIFSISIGIFLYTSPTFHDFLLSLNSLGYFASFIAGILFTSIITTGTSIVMLLTLAEELNTVTMATIAGFGAVVGDLLILKYFKDNLAEELNYLWQKSKIGEIKPIKFVLNSKLFIWMLPILGAIAIASPLPDEVGVGFLGISNLPRKTFILISYVLNTLGILFVLEFAAFVK
jgi:hypothetical protein